MNPVLRRTHARINSLADAPTMSRPSAHSMVALEANRPTMEASGTRDSASDVACVPVADLGEADSPRNVGLNLDHVQVLAQCEDPLPPVLVHRETMRVVDGVHRVAAAQLAGRSHVDVRFVDGDAEAAFRAGVSANVVHGLPLSLAERKAAAVRIMGATPTLSDRSVGSLVGLSHKTVAAIRADLAMGASAESRIGKDGRARPLTTAVGRLRASQIIAERPQASLREIAREAGISVGTARDVRLRISAGDDPVASRRSPRSVGAAGPDERAAVLDPMGILEVLRRDPSLKYSDAGRALLRWLDQRMISVEMWRGASEGVPGHCMEHVARIAREYARVWNAVAETIEVA